MDSIDHNLKRIKSALSKRQSKISYALAKLTTEQSSLQISENYEKRVGNSINDKNTVFNNKGFESTTSSSLWSIIRKVFGMK